MSEPFERSQRLVGSSKRDQRNAFQRDRDRILYTHAFRRLSGVTQVARVGESYTFHDRLSHSLKVAQIGRRITEYFLNETEGPDVPSGLEIHPDVVETSALGHDLGHPPFGHAAEKTLNKVITEDFGVHDGFEGNAQSFRTVARLSAHDEVEEGLNLTMASLNALIKYPWERGDDQSEKNEWGVNEYDKWGHYSTETDVFEKARTLSSQEKRPCPEACIMDWADDLAYAVHDMEDFYRAGIIPLEQLLERSVERDEFLEYIENHSDITWGRGREILDWLRKTGGETLLTPYRGTRKERKQLDYFSSTLINRYVGREKGGVELQNTADDAPYLDIDENMKQEVELLKKMTYYYVISNPSLSSQQRGEKKIVEKLFNILYGCTLPDDSEALDKVEQDLMPEDVGMVPYRFKQEVRHQKEEGTKQTRVRTAADIICSMTEQQTILMYERLTGSAPGSIRDQIVT